MSRGAVTDVLWLVQLVRSLAAASKGPRRECNGSHERHSLDQVREPWQAGIPELQSLHRDSEEVQGHDRPRNVESAWLDLGRSQEYGGEGRQQVWRPCTERC